MADPRAVPVSIVGLHGGQWFGTAAEDALRRADVLIGAQRQLDLLPADFPAQQMALGGALEEVLDEAAARAGAGERVCVLASGDPGFFGVVRLAAARVDALSIHPAPSAVSIAFARVGINWEDALVVSAHGRPLAHAVDAIASHPKVAVLVSPDQPPQALGRELIAAGCGPRRIVVCARLAEPAESLTHCDLAGLAAGDFDPVSVVVALAPQASEHDQGMALSWGTPEQDFAHRRGMITKAEVRAVALGKLSIPATGVLWDVGAGSGSVAVECARLAPGLRVYAIERNADDLAALRANAQGTAVTVVHGEAPAALADLPPPDRVFVGGGGLAVLDEALRRLRPAGVVVATYAALDRALSGARRLGQVVQIAVSRGVPVGSGGSIRLAAENPVFVCWGPQP